MFHPGSQRATRASDGDVSCHMAPQWQTLTKIPLLCLVFFHLLLPSPSLSLTNLSLPWRPVWLPRLAGCPPGALRGVHELRHGGVLTPQRTPGDGSSLPLLEPSCAPWLRWPRCCSAAPYREDPARGACSMAVLVDHGFGGGVQVAHGVCVVFFGGPDNKESGGTTTRRRDG